MKATSALDRVMWEEMHSNWEGFAIEAQNIIDQITPDQSHEIDDADAWDYVGLDKVVVTTARVGQAFFRSAVISAYNDRCCISGLALPRLLIASHIVPWRQDKSNRVNPRNGLSLSALHDKAFDSGLITINEDMTVRVSQSYSGNRDPFFTDSIEGFDGKPIFLPEKFSPEPKFLAYQREHIFQG